MNLVTSPPSPAGPRLLFLDDDADLRRLVDLYLSPRGYRVTLAEETEEAAALLEFRPFEFFCADLSLDGLERFEALDLIAEARRRSPDLKIVVQTGADDPTIHAACLARGANAVLVKRGSLERLWQTLIDFSPGGAACAAV